MHHNLKAVKKSFQPLWDGQLTHQNRFGDRHFSPGDTVTFHEGSLDWKGTWKPTGRTISARISLVTTYALLPGWVGLSLKSIGMTLGDGLMETPNGL